MLKPSTILNVLCAAGDLLEQRVKFEMWNIEEVVVLRLGACQALFVSG